MKIVLETKYRKWHQGDGFFSVGYMFINNELLKDKQLGEYIKVCIKQGMIETILQKANGCFAVICCVEDKIYLIVDKFRSYPLLYTTSYGNCIVSDSANGFEENISEYSLNEFAAAELLSLGYLSGDKTLLQDVFNVESGSYVIIDSKNILKKNYDKLDLNKQNFQDEVLIRKSSKILEETFERMIRTIGSKQIVIPLSGGYDSRLIACLCKKMGLRNVLCFTYGRKDSFEVSMSKKVADVLGFDWYFVEYTQEIIHKWINTPIWGEYINYVGNLNVNPSVQGIFALLELKERGIIHAENSVFIPGHAGDVIGGSHMPSLNIMKSKSLDKILFDQYYVQNNLNVYWNNKVMESLRKMVGNEDLSVDEKYDRHYFWNVKNRQAHFIINSVRTFEFIGSEWRIPLWDTEYCAFWDSVVWVKKRKKIYNKFMFESYFNEMKVDFVKDALKQSLIKRVARNILPEWLKYKIHYCINSFSKTVERPHFNSFDIMVNNLKCSSHEYFCKEIKTDIDSTLSRYYLDFILGKLLK